MEFLGYETAVILGLKLAGGLIASTTAIFLWSQTREPAWIVMILASILSYGEVLFELLDRLGIFSWQVFQFMGISVLKASFAGGVPLVYALAFFLALRSRKP